MRARLVYNPPGSPVLEDSTGRRWIVRQESPHLVFVSEETHERRVAPLPDAWEHLSAEELEQYCRAARPKPD